MKPLISKYTTWMYSNPNATQSQSESKFDQLFNSMINMDKIEKKVMKTWCESKGGKVLKDGKCTYKNSIGCSRHYKMVNGIPEDTFTQWDSRGSKCMVADHTIKKMCEENKLKYNSRTGICEVTKELCLQKGTNWDSSKKDCIIPREQEVMEFIFGTTITRGFKQVFDPAQYKPHPSGTSDHGYICNKHSRNPLPCTAYGSKWYNEGLRCANMILSSTIPAR